MSNLGKMITNGIKAVQAQGGIKRMYDKKKEEDEDEDEKKPSWDKIMQMLGINGNN